MCFYNKYVCRWKMKITEVNIMNYPSAQQRLAFNSPTNSSVTRMGQVGVPAPGTDCEEVPESPRLGVSTRAGVGPSWPCMAIGVDRTALHYTQHHVCGVLDKWDKWNNAPSTPRSLCQSRCSPNPIYIYLGAGWGEQMRHQDQLPRSPTAVGADIPTATAAAAAIAWAGETSLPWTCASHLPPAYNGWYALSPPPHPHPVHSTLWSC